MRRLLLLVPALLLAACDRPVDDRFFPLGSGHRWTYRSTTVFEDPAVPAETDTLEVRSLGAGEWGGSRAWHRVTDTGHGWWLRADDTGIYRVASEGPQQAQALADSPVSWVLRRPLQVGTAWEGRTVPYVLQRRNEQPRELRYLDRYKNLVIKYRIEQLDQAVDTPAGHFTGCIVVAGTSEVYQYSDELLAYRNAPLLAREWYCPGVGLVRQERVEHATTRFLLGGTVLLELMRWN